MPRSGVASDQVSKPDVPERNHVPCTVERMGPRVLEFGRVADIVEIRRRHEHVCVVRWQALHQLLDERAWPTVPQLLMVVLAQQVIAEIGTPKTGPILDQALCLIRETGAAPELRAAVLELLAELDLELLEHHQDGTGTFAARFIHSRTVRQAFTLNPAGNLLRESLTLLDADDRLGIPAGTALEKSTYEPTVPWPHFRQARSGNCS